MADGAKRKRRTSPKRTAAQRKWYAEHRARRFKARDLSGEAGDDYLDGGYDFYAHVGRLWGGKGSDQFVWRTHSRFPDFSAAEDSILGY